MLVKNLIQEAIEKRGKFQICRIIKNSDIILWCETPGYNLEREYRIEATINKVDGTSKEWNHSMVLTKKDQYSEPGTIEELKAFEIAIWSKVILSA